MSEKSKKDTELQGLTHLITDATVGITSLVEEVHKKVVNPSFLPSTIVQKTVTKVTSFTYNNIRWSTKIIGNSISKILEKLNPIIGEIKASDKKENLLSVLNGVIGDYLEETKNSLQIKMHFRFQSKVLKIDTKSLEETAPIINGKILLMIHGSCMNAIQWTRENHNHGEIIAEDLQKTPIYLNYNSGKHISSNGKELTILLEELINNWPVPVEEFTIIGHSMGGLVLRSALFYGQKQEYNWTSQLNKVVFLGTPHHGSPIERSGTYLDLILENTPYLKPFAKLGKIRSAGVTDLRYGNLVDEDWQNKDRFERKRDQRQNIPLPKNIDFYCVGAVIGKKQNSFSNKILGDTLVDLKSALGQHKKPDKNLRFEEENVLVIYESNHLDLLNNPEILVHLKEWLV